MIHTSIHGGWIVVLVLSSIISGVLQHVLEEMEEKYLDDDSEGTPPNWLLGSRFATVTVGRVVDLALGIVIAMSVCFGG